MKMSQESAASVPGRSRRSRASWAARSNKSVGGDPLINYKKLNLLISTGKSLFDERYEKVTSSI